MGSSIFLLLLIFSDDDEEKTQGLAQIIIAGLYFWNGLQKLNFTFLHETLPSLFENIFPEIRVPFVFLGISIAVIESLIGIGLLFRKTRKTAVCLAVLMHAAVMGLLIAKNYNSIVWIWNIMLISMIVVLFWKSDFSINRTFQKPKDWTIFVVAASVLLPILSFFGFWEMYLSGALYSGNVEIAVIRIDDKTLEKLSPKARQSIFQTANGGGKILPLVEWSISELNVPVYPERRVSKKIALEICRLTDNKNRIELIIKERPAILDGSYEITRITCAELEKP